MVRIPLATASGIVHRQGMNFLLEPLTADEAHELRRLGGERYVADTHPGFPCRQCLRDAEIGEELILVSHTPFRSDTAYRSASPIFVHRDDCGAPASSSELPIQLTRRQLSVRAFDRTEMMIDATVIDGDELGSTLERFFSDAETDRIHVHNATRGCWATTISRG